ncbi:hypothetical protein JCM10512_42 [Bacteroides reticulotermitis JCM 10512]|uniref:Fibronectin type III-like domain-containing protein n=1 Tax=Bacteroides reticulotermitis JCM 10512 TaxID=1445607 RepID=W4UL49_9BACE|nr:hypothetical protein JCM10512_42 [Bacteroides reticulotermitis JCM 10512]
MNAGETKCVNVTLPANAFEFFDTQTNTMRILSGKYKLLYGSSPDEKQLAIQLE